MPIVFGKYQNPGWVNGQRPAINAAELNAISDTLEKLDAPPSLANPGSAGDLLAGKQLIDANGNVLTGTMPEVTQTTPWISVSSGGLITASATQSAGYVALGTKRATKQLDTQAAATITPGTSAKTAVAAGRYTTGAVTVAGDPNLAPGNIKSGVSIFGVNGNYEGDSLSNLSLAVATAYQPISPTITASKITVTMPSTYLKPGQNGLETVSLNLNDIVFLIIPIGYNQYRLNGGNGTYITSIEIVFPFLNYVGSYSSFSYTTVDNIGYSGMGGTPFTKGSDYRPPFTISISGRTISFSLTSGSNMFFPVDFGLNNTHIFVKV